MTIEPLTRFVNRSLHRDLNRDEVTIEVYTMKIETRGFFCKTKKVVATVDWKMTFPSLDEDYVHMCITQLKQLPEETENKTDTILWLEKFIN